MPKYELKFSLLLLVSVLCFICFLLGWMAGVFIAPGQKLKQEKTSFFQIKTQEKQEGLKAQLKGDLELGPAALKEPTKADHSAPHNKNGLRFAQKTKPNSLNPQTWRPLTQPTKPNSLNLQTWRPLTQPTEPNSLNPLLGQMTRNILFLMNPYAELQGAPLKNIGLSGAPSPSYKRNSAAPNLASANSKVLSSHPADQAPKLKAQNKSKNRKLPHVLKSAIRPPFAPHQTEGGKMSRLKTSGAESFTTPKNLPTALDKKALGAKPPLKARQTGKAALQDSSSKRAYPIPLDEKAPLTNSSLKKGFKKTDKKALAERKDLTGAFSSPAHSAPPASKKKRLEVLPQGASLSPLQKLQREYKQKNQQQLAAIEAKQKFFKPDGQLSFFINAFTDGEKAKKYVQGLKSQYPLWSVLLKPHQDHTRVYIGPFRSRKLAEEFKRLWLETPDFESAFLEEISL